MRCQWYSTLCVHINTPPSILQNHPVDAHLVGWWALKNEDLTSRWGPVGLGVGGRDLVRALAWPIACSCPWVGVVCRG